jgi:tetratricopeptide (TPR) repeat protein
MNLRRYIYSALVLVGLFGLSAAVAAPGDDFKAANQLYDNGKFAEAAAAYEKIEPKTAHVYYNLGNAWFRQNKLGLAILDYARARQLAPRDPDIVANLKFAQQRLGVDEINTPPQATQRLLRSVVESRTASEWSVGELVGLWLLALTIGARVYFPKLRTGVLIVAVAGLAGFGFSTFALTYQVIGDHAAPQAIVVNGETEARFAPVPDSTVHFRLAEGTRVSIREDRGQWLFVERADGQQGWVKSEAVGRITSS